MANDYTLRLRAEDNASAAIKNVRKELEATTRAATPLEDLRSKFARIATSGMRAMQMGRKFQRLLKDGAAAGVAKSDLDAMRQKMAQVTAQAQRAEKGYKNLTNAYASRTPMIDAASTALTGITSAASVATSAVALLGGENNEAAQKMLLFVNAATGMATGAQGLATSIKGLAAAQLAFNRALQTSAVGVAAAAVLALTAATAAAVVQYAKMREEEARQLAAMQMSKTMTEAVAGVQKGLAASARSVSSDIGKEVAALRTASATLRDNAASLKDKQSALNTVKQLVPDVSKKIDGQSNAFATAADEADKYADSLYDVAYALALMKEAEKLAAKEVENNINLRRSQNELERRQRVERGARDKLARLPQGGTTTFTSTYGSFTVDAENKQTAAQRVVVANQHQRTLNSQNEVGAYQRQAVILNEQKDILNGLRNDFKKSNPTAWAEAIRRQGGGKTTSPTPHAASGGRSTGVHTAASTEVAAVAGSLKAANDEVAALQKRLDNTAPNTAAFNALAAQLGKAKTNAASIQAAMEKAVKSAQAMQLARAGGLTASALPIAAPSAVGGAGVSAAVGISDLSARVTSMRQLAASAIESINTAVDAGEIGSEMGRNIANGIIDALKRAGDSIGAAALKSNALLEDTKGLRTAAGAAATAFSSMAAAVGGSAGAALNVAGLMAAAIAKMVEGYAWATANAGKLGPWAWLAFGLTGLGQLATMVAGVKSMGGYADGGVIAGGSTHGDNLVARVNAGEMILNGSQQRRLFNLLDGGGSPLMGGNVTFTINGSTLQGVLRNYNSKIGKIK